MRGAYLRKAQVFASLAQVWARGPLGEKRELYGHHEALGVRRAAASPPVSLGVLERSGSGVRGIAPPADAP